MPKEIIITATKPASSSLEYGIRDTVTKAWLRHGELVTVDVAGLTAPQQATILGSRNIIASAAASQQDALGLPQSVTVVTTDPQTMQAYYVEVGRETEPPKQVTLRLVDLSPSDQATLVATKALFTSIATADATTKGFLP